jgi:Lrp/AsnC family transcriptional regulator for asnA, asnC and gidA
VGIFLEKGGYYEDVARQLQDIQEIVECHYTTGQYAIFVKVYARDNEHLKEILSGKVQKISGISSTETFISLEETFKRQVPIQD